MSSEPATWMLVFLRVSGLLAVFPVFSSPNVPVRIRVALGAMTAFLIAPAVPAASFEGATFWAVTGRMATEVGVGLLLGFVSRMIFFALELAGAVISTEMGLQLPPNFNPMLGIQAAAPTAMLTLLAVVIWLSLDLHHWLLVAFQRSYELLPIGQARLGHDLLVDVLARCGKLFGVALLIAAPVMAVSFIISLVFSVLGRAVPQMNVFIESFSIRILAGLVVLGLTFQLIAQHVVNYLRRLPEDILLVARLLAG